VGWMVRCAGAIDVPLTRGLKNDKTRLRTTAERICLYPPYRPVPGRWASISAAAVTLDRANSGEIRAHGKIVGQAVGITQPRAQEPCLGVYALRLGCRRQQHAAENSRQTQLWFNPTACRLLKTAFVPTKTLPVRARLASHRQSTRLRNSICWSGFWHAGAD